MAKNKNNTTLYIVLAIAAVFLFNNGFTGNYISNYHSTSDPSVLGCYEGKWDCEYNEAKNGWVTRVCKDRRWEEVEFCGTLLNVGDSGCVYKRIDYGNTQTICRSPHLAAAGSPNYRSTTY